MKTTRYTVPLVVALIVVSLGIGFLSGCDSGPNASSSTSEAPAVSSSASSSPAEAGAPDGSWRVVQLTDTFSGNSWPSLTKDYVVWSGLDEETGYLQIYLFDLATGATARLTHDPSHHMYPQVNESHVIWEQSERDFLLHDVEAGKTTTIAQSVQRYGMGLAHPLLQGDLVVWQEQILGGTDQISLKNITLPISVYSIASGETTVLSETGKLPATDGRHVAWVERTEEASTIMLFDSQTGSVNELPKKYFLTGAPWVDGGRIVWSASDGKKSSIYLYDIASNETEQISEPSASLYFPRMDGNLLVWKQNQISSTSTTQPFGESEPGASIVLFDSGSGGGKVIVSDNVLPGTQPQVKDGLVTWAGVANHEAVVFLYHVGSEEIFQLSLALDSMSYAYLIPTGGGRVAWTQPVDEKHEVFLATRDSLPPSR